MKDLDQLSQISVEMSRNINNLTKFSIFQYTQQEHCLGTEKGSFMIIVLLDRIVPHFFSFLLAVCNNNLF
jgi:hypothetical protein